MILMSTSCWSAKGYLWASHHNMHARMVGCDVAQDWAMSRLGVASELTTRLRTTRYLPLKIRPTQDFIPTWLQPCSRLFQQDSCAVSVGLPLRVPDAGLVGEIRGMERSGPYDRLVKETISNMSILTYVPI